MSVNFAVEKREVSRRFLDIMNDLKSCGLRALKEIPVDLLDIDESYQTPFRTSSKKRKKQIESLAKKWDENRLEPITVVPHLETGKFFITNGYGRLMASQMQSPKYEYLWAIVLLSPIHLSPNERRKFESEMFAYQNDSTSAITPLHVHHALLNLEKEEVLILEKLKKEFKFKYADDKGMRGGGVLGSYKDFVNIAKRQGEDCLRYIFEICKTSAFDRKPNGYASYVSRTLRDIWVYYPSHRDETKKYISNYLRDKMPVNFRALSVSKYPMLDLRMACSLYIEDVLVENLSLDKTREVFNGKTTKVVNLGKKLNNA